MSGGGIYGITYNGVVVYIGQSQNVSRRFTQHRCTLRGRYHRNFVLQRIFDKHPESLEFVTLEEIADPADFTDAEQRWMDKLKPAANLAKANGSFPHTEETRARMRAHVRSPEHCAKLSVARRGKAPANKGVRGKYKHTDEAKAKIAEAGRRQVVSLEAREARSHAQKGRIFTNEHREKLRAAKLGKPNEAVRKAMTGRKQPAETVAKRVAGVRATMERRREVAVSGAE